MSKFDFKRGDIIRWCDGLYRVRNNFGDTGEVETLDGGQWSGNFYWNFQGEVAELVQRAEGE